MSTGSSLTLSTQDNITKDLFKGYFEGDDEAYAAFRDNIDNLHAMPTTDDFSVGLDLLREMTGVKWAQYPQARDKFCATYDEGKNNGWSLAMLPEGFSAVSLEGMHRPLKDKTLRSTKDKDVLTHLKLMQTRVFHWGMDDRVEARNTEWCEQTLAWKTKARKGKVDGDSQWLPPHPDMKPAHWKHAFTLENTMGIAEFIREPPTENAGSIKDNGETCVIVASDKLINNIKDRRPGAGLEKRMEKEAKKFVNFKKMSAAEKLRKAKKEGGLEGHLTDAHRFHVVTKRPDPLGGNPMFSWRCDCKDGRTDMHCGHTLLVGMKKGDITSQAIPKKYTKARVDTQAKYPSGR